MIDRRWLAMLFVLALAVSALSHSRVSAAAILDPALEEALSGASASDTFEVIVNFDESQTDATTLTTDIQELGAGVIQFKHLSMLATRATSNQISEIQALPGVQSLYLNQKLEWMLAESIRSIRADEVHAQGVTGKGVGVAILDSGIDGLYNPDVRYPERTVQNAKYAAASEDLYSDLGDPGVNVAADLFVENLPNSETSIGHGTHVAGIAAGDGSASGGKYTGVAPGADLVGIGTGDVLFIFWALAGFDYVLDNQEEYNIQVVNNSWGSGGDFDPDHPINEATKEVHDAGVTVVFSAGNSGPDQDTMNTYSVAPWVISVAAGCKLVEDPTGSAVHCEDPTGAGRDPIVADFSSRGIPGDDLVHPDIIAPGVHIVSDRASTGTVMNGLDSNHDARICNISVEHQPYYTCASGTSMSAPHVAGVVALMEEAASSDLTPDDVLDILVKSAQRLKEYEEWEVGAGYLDAAEAVKRAATR